MRRKMHLTRRSFIRTAAAGGGFAFCSCGFSAVNALAAFQAPAATRRQISIGGKRIRTIDMHAHVWIDDVFPLIKDRKQIDPALAGLGRSFMAIDAATLDRRFKEMDRIGIDVHVISVHPSQFLYWTEPELAARIVTMQNEKVAELVTAHKDRFVGFGNVSLQQPDLAVEQLEYAVKKLDLRGFIVGANVNGGELSNPKLDPFWKKAGGLGKGAVLPPHRSAGPGRHPQ